MYSMIGVKGGKTVGIGRGGKNLIKKKKNKWSSLFSNQTSCKFTNIYKR